MSSRVPAVPEAPGDLRRVLGAWDAAALIVGIIIGSGIFATPPLVASHLPGVLGILGIWALGGVMALCGALCYAELSGMFPRTGGSFVFLREGYGRFPAFAYGWSALLITYPASIAGVAVVFTAYLARLVPIPDPARGAVAAALCLLLAGVNGLGVRLGAWTLKLFTGAKVLALGAVVLAALLLRHGAGAHLHPLWGVPEGGIHAGGVALALAAVIWTYEGWTDGPTVAGEVRDPDRDMVRALMIGALGVTVIYVLANLAYVAVLGVDGVRGSDSVAVDVAGALFGNAGQVYVTLLVLVSTLGSIMGMIIGASRVFYAMGREGLFFPWVGRVHPRRGTPLAALAGVGIISAVYALLGTFEGIVSYFIFVSTIWLILNIASVIRHRMRRPGLRRPFRVPFYPLPPLVYLGVACGLLVQLFLQNIRNSMVGLGILAVSVPVFLAWERLRAAR